MSEKVEIDKVLEPFAIDCYGNVRTPAQVAESALNAAVNNVTLVHRAIYELGQEMTSNEHTQILTAASDLLEQTSQIMNKSLLIFGDCDIKEW